MNERAELLCLSLEAAVPLWIAELRERPVSEVRAAAVERGKEWAELIASKGDVLQFGSKKKGETAGIFNELALALAHLSFWPGGVKFAGVRWSAFPARGLLLVSSRDRVSCVEWRDFDAMPDEQGRTFFVPDAGETWFHSGPEWGWRLAASVTEGPKLLAEKLARMGPLP